MAGDALTIAGTFLLAVPAGARVLEIRVVAAEPLPGPSGSGTAAGTTPDEDVAQLSNRERDVLAGVRFWRWPWGQLGDA